MSLRQLRRCECVYICVCEIIFCLFRRCCCVLCWMVEYRTSALWPHRDCWQNIMCCCCFNVGCFRRVAFDWRAWRRLMVEAVVMVIVLYFVLPVLFIATYMSFRNAKLRTTSIDTAPHFERRRQTNVKVIFARTAYEPFKSSRWPHILTQTVFVRVSERMTELGNLKVLSFVWQFLWV